MVKFEELGISQPILKALQEMGFETPTEVQSKAIPHILNKEDIIVISKTGSGKTAVFGIPVLQLTDSNTAVPQCLILTPTRELAVQIDNDIKKMAKHLQHKTTAVYGKHSMNTEVETLKKGVSIITGTPGRVFDHFNQGNLKLNNIRFLVLDEADRMLDMGFIDQVRRIVKALPKERVTLLFSATIPYEIRKTCISQMKNPQTIEIESPTMTVDTIKQLYYRVNRNEKRTQLNRLLLAHQPESGIIFCNTRIAVDSVQSFLAQKGYSCQALHGEIPQGKRLQTIQQFKQGKFPFLVATDVAARGLDINNLAMVINYDVPEDMDSYVHRIGRTGRAGKDGLAISLVTSNDIMSLYAIEEHIGVLIEETDLPTDEALAANKEAIEQWKLSKSAPVKQTADSTVENHRGFKNKPVNKQLPRNNENRRTQPQNTHNENRKPYENRQQNNTIQQKPYKPYVKTTAPAPEIKKTVVTAVPVAETPKTEKSFFKNIISKIFGKK